MPAAAMAFSPVMMLASLGSMPGGQKRRSRMPVISSSRPSGKLQPAIQRLQRRFQLAPT